MTEEAQHCGSSAEKGVGIGVGHNLKHKTAMSQCVNSLMQGYTNKNGIDCYNQNDLPDLFITTTALRGRFYPV